MSGAATPIQGVPLPAHGTRYGNGAVPRRIEPEDTGALSTRMVATLADVGTMGTTDHKDGADEFLDKLAAKLMEKSGGGGGGSGTPPKTFLGLSTSDWTKLVIGWSIALVAFLGTWYMSVRDGLAERPTTDQVTEAVKNTIGDHAGGVHPATEHKIQIIEHEQKKIRESQIRQEESAKAQTETLGEIKQELVRIRRQR